MSKIVILCESYGNIATALYVLTDNPGATSITLVVPGFHDLYKFFQVINEKVFHNKINLLYIEPYRPGRVKAKGINKIFHVIPDIFKERRYLKDTYNKYFADTEGAEVYFFSRGFSGFKLYLLEKLTKRNKLVFVSSAPPHYFRQYTPTRISDMVSLAIAKLIFGFDIAMGKLPYTDGFLYIPDKFIKKKVGKVIGWEDINEMMKGFDSSRFRVFDVGDYGVIYFDDAIINYDYVTDVGTFERELSQFFGILGKYFSAEEIAFKYHPGDDSRNTPVMKGSSELPAFIPAEFLYNDCVRMYLTVCSYAIVNVEKGLAVSLLDSVSVKDEITRKRLKEVLTRSQKSEILFPKTLEEFERILIDLKE